MQKKPTKRPRSNRQINSSLIEFATSTSVFGNGRAVILRRISAKRAPFDPSKSAIAHAPAYPAMMLLERLAPVLVQLGFEEYPSCLWEAFFQIIL